MTAAGSLAIALHRQRQADSYPMNIRELRTGFLCADNKNDWAGWVLSGTMVTIGLFMFIFGILWFVIGTGIYPQEEMDLWNAGLPGLLSFLLGTWFLWMETRSAIGFARLLVDSGRVKVIFVTFWKTIIDAEASLTSEDCIAFHLREDAEQNLYSVSADLMLHCIGKVITLHLEAVPNNDFNAAATIAFDRAEEIGSNIGVRICQ